MIASCEVAVNVVVILTWIYFDVTMEPYLVSVTQVGITTSQENTQKKDVDIWKIQKEFQTKVFTVEKLIHCLVLEIIK